MNVLRVLFIFAGLVAIGMAAVTLRTEVRQTGYRIGRMQDRQQTLKRRCLELGLDVARLRNPLRLDAEGRRIRGDEDGSSHSPHPTAAQHVTTRLDVD